MIRSYANVILLPTIEERFEYLKLNGQVGSATFGSHRYLNQQFYTCDEWLEIRDRVIARDRGNDLAMPGFEIHGIIHIHHINPISIEDILNRAPCLFDLDNLICVSELTHKAIHYGNVDLLPKLPVERKPNDTCPWRIA